MKTNTFSLIIAIGLVWLIGKSNSTKVRSVANEQRDLSFTPPLDNPATLH